MAASTFHDCCLPKFPLAKDAAFRLAEVAKAVGTQSTDLEQGEITTLDTSYLYRLMLPMWALIYALELRTANCTSLQAG